MPINDLRQQLNTWLDALLINGRKAKPEIILRGSRCGKENAARLKNDALLQGIARQFVGIQIFGAAHPITGTAKRGRISMNSWTNSEPLWRLNRNYRLHSGKSIKQSDRIYTL